MNTLKDSFLQTARTLNFKIPKKEDPLEHLRPYIEEASRETGLDKNLIKAKIMRESGGRIDARPIDPDTGALLSSAYGPSQLLEGTAQEVGVDRMDPRENVLGGARYLKKQVDAFGDVETGLTAYFKGPGAVQKYGRNVPGTTGGAEAPEYVRDILRRKAEFDERDRIRYDSALRNINIDAVRAAIKKKLGDKPEQPLSSEPQAGAPLINASTGSPIQRNTRIQLLQVPAPGNEQVGPPEEKTRITLSSFFPDLWGAFSMGTTRGTGDIVESIAARKRVGGFHPTKLVEKTHRAVLEQGPELERREKLHEGMKGRGITPRTPLNDGERQVLKAYKDIKKRDKDASFLQDISDNIIADIPELRIKKSQRAMELVSTKEAFKNPLETLMGAVVVTAEQSPQFATAMLGKAVGGGAMFERERGGFLRSAREAGVTDPFVLNKYANFYGIPSAIVEYATDSVIMAPFKGLIKAGKDNPIVKEGIKKTRKAALVAALKAAGKTIGKGAMEGLEEVAQDNISNVMLWFALGEQAQITDDPIEKLRLQTAQEGMDLNPITVENLKNSFPTFMVGFVSGTVAAGTASGVASGIRRLRRPKDKTAVSNPVTGEPLPLEVTLTGDEGALQERIAGDVVSKEAPAAEPVLAPSVAEQGLTPSATEPVRMTTGNPVRFNELSQKIGIVTNKDLDALGELADQNTPQAKAEIAEKLKPLNDKEAEEFGEMFGDGMRITSLTPEVEASIRDFYAKRDEKPAEAPIAETPQAPSRPTIVQPGPKDKAAVAKLSYKLKQAGIPVQVQGGWQNPALNPGRTEVSAEFQIEDPRPEYKGGKINITVPKSKWTVDGIRGEVDRKLMEFEIAEPVKAPETPPVTAKEPAAPPVEAKPIEEPVSLDAVLGATTEADIDREIIKLSKKAPDGTVVEDDSGLSYTLRTVTYKSGNVSKMWEPTDGKGSPIIIDIKTDGTEKVSKNTSVFWDKRENPKITLPSSSSETKPVVPETTTPTIEPQKGVPNVQEETSPVLKEGKKTIAERRVAAILDKPHKYSGVPRTSKRELVERVVSEGLPGYSYVEKDAIDTTAKKRDEETVARAQKNYLLVPKDKAKGSNANIPEVKEAYEAMERLGAGYPKKVYRLVTPSGSFFDASKTEYDYAQQLLSAKTKTPEKPQRPEVVAPEAPKKPEATPKAKGGAKEFYISTKDGFDKVDAKPVVIAGAEDHDFFIRKDEDDQWIISHAKTGTVVRRGEYGGSRQHVIDRLVEMIQVAGKENLEKAVSRAIEKTGISPAYKEASDTKKEESTTKVETKKEPKRFDPEGTVPGTSDLVAAVKSAIEAGTTLNNPKLTELANKAFKGTQAQGTYGPRDSYDAAEAALNQVIEKQGIDFTDPEGSVQKLQKLTDQMPRQTDRTNEQVELQQFSTPPAEAFVVAWVSGIKKGMKVLEPSAGDGNIATQARMMGGEVTANEIAPRRLGILQLLGFKTTNVSGEQLDNLLPTDIVPDVVVMNPPFSATGGRVAAHKTSYGARHVEQALLRLKPGGRLVAIVGGGMAHDKAGFQKWWTDIEGKYNVRANLGMKGSVYGKYGTTFDNNILVIDKTGPTPGEGRAARVKNIIRGDSMTPLEAVRVLENLSKEDVYGRINRESGKVSPKEAGDTAGKQEAPASGTGERAPGRGGRKPSPDTRGATDRGTVGDVAGLGENEPGVRGEPSGKGDKQRVGKDQGGDRGRTEGKSDRGPEDGAGTTTDRGPTGTGMKDRARAILQKKLEKRGIIDTKIKKEVALRDDSLAKAEDAAKRLLASFSNQKPGRLGTIGSEQIELGFEVVSNLIEAGVHEFNALALKLQEILGDAANNAEFKQVIEDSYDSYTEVDDTLPKRTQSFDEAVKPVETSEVETKDVAMGEEQEGGVFSEYKVRKAHIKGSKKHPANIVESATLATVEPPDVTYKPSIPKDVVEGGKLSDVQLEAVIYSGQRHEQRLPDGSRAESLINDGCVAGETRIYNPVSGEYTTIAELERIGKEHTVLSLTKNGFEPRPAWVPFMKGVAKLYNVVLDDGRSIVVTSEHRFLTPRGWLTIDGGLLEGHFLSCAEGRPAYNLGLSRSARDEGGRNFFGKAEDYLLSCSDFSRQYDERLLWEQDSDQDAFPLQGDADEHIPGCSQTDDRDFLSRCSHRHLSIPRPSKSNSFVAENLAPSLISIQGDEGCAQPLLSKRGALGQSQYLTAPLRHSDEQALADQSFFGHLSYHKYSRWHRITGITFVKTDIYYDMYVPGPENYVAEGIVNHNTGLGKGREIAGIILDNLMKGRKKHLWVSVGRDLFTDAQRDLYTEKERHLATGFNPDRKLEGVGVPLKLIDVGSYKVEEKIADKEGVLFIPYTLLAGEWKKDKRRYEQVRKWLGDDFDGVMAFDEAHKMKNALAAGIGGKIGDGTNQGAAGMLLKSTFKDARVVNVSATAATTPANLGYLTRMGLWGPGTAFPNFPAFIGAMQAGGVGAMEMLARDLKAIGASVARIISYKGKTAKDTVQYESLVHEMTPEEKSQYDEVALMWSKIMKAFDEAAKNAGMGKNKSNKFSAFYSSQQRFFLQYMMSFQLNDMLEAASKDLEDGKSIVISMYNTNEGATKKAVGEAKANDIDLEDIDFTPREMIASLIKENFPVQQYEDVTDPITGKTTPVPMKHKDGSPVINRENQRAQEELLETVSRMSMPTNPMDAIANYFGADKVAEITGRSKRLEGGRYDPKSKSITGKVKYVTTAVKGISKDKRRNAQIQQFQSGKKKVALISGAASTGISLHSDANAKNQDRRVFYAMQLSWSADTQMQAFGRVHRAFQTSAPIIKLVQVDVAGQRRLVNTVSSRLASVGAVSTGTRDAYSGGIFAVEDITDENGQAALGDLYSRTGDFYADFEQMGILNEDGNIKGSSDGNVDQFLNRIMALPVDRQNLLYDEFYKSYQRIVETAKENGTFDSGVEHLNATDVKQVGKSEVINVHSSGARTELVTLEGSVKNNTRSFEQVSKMAGDKKMAFAKNNKSGKLWAVYESWSPGRYWLEGPNGSKHSVDKGDVTREKYTPIPSEEAKKEWDAEYAKIPEYSRKKFYLITGAVYPIYNKLFKPGMKSKIIRTTTTSGDGFVGVRIDEKDIVGVKTRLGIGSALKNATPQEIYNLVRENDSPIEFDNGWVIKGTKVHGEDRIEVDYRATTPPNRQEMEGYGTNEVMVDYRKRYFVPIDPEDGPAVIEKIMQNHKPIRDISVAQDESSGDPQALSAKTWDFPLEAEASTEKRTTLTEVWRFVEKSFNLALRGRATHKWKNAGMYYPKAWVARLRKWGDIPPMTHEVAHHIDMVMKKKLGSDWKTKSGLVALRELKALDYDQKNRIPEGFAEWVRIYLTSEKDMAPEFSKYFWDAVKAEPKIRESMEELGKMIGTWRSMGSMNRVLAQIDMRGEHTNLSMTQKVAVARRLLVEKFVDTLDSFSRVNKALGLVSRKNIRPSQDPVEYARRVMSKSRAIARTFVTEKAINSRGEIVGKGLTEILSPITIGSKSLREANDKMKVFLAYAVAKRAKNLEKRGIESGFDKEDIANVLNEYKSKEWDDVVDDITKWNNNVTDWLIEAGSLSEADAAVMRELNPSYVPFKRAFVDEALAIKAGGGLGGGINTGKGVHRIKGSGRPIINPIESMVGQVTSIIEKANKVHIARMFADMADKEGMGRFIHEVRTPMEGTKINIDTVVAQLEKMGLEVENLADVDTDALMTIFTQAAQYRGKDNVIQIWRNGERKFYEVDPEIYRAMVSMDVQKRNILQKILAPFARMLRLGATGLNVAFSMATNPGRDVPTFLTFSKKRLANPKDVLTGLAKSINPEEGSLFWRYQALGGKMSGMMGYDRVSTMRLYDEILSDNLKGMGKVLYVAQHPMAIINYVTDVLSFWEQAPRSAELHQMYKEYREKHTDWTEEDAFIAAFNDAQDVTVNFTRGGQYAKALNETNAFFNVAIQGPDKLYRAFRDRPVETALKGLIWMTIPAIISWIRNRDKEWWKNLPLEYKYSNYFIELPGGAILRIPTPFELGLIFAGIPMAIMDQEKGAGEAIFNALKSSIPSIVPSAVEPMLDIARNKNYLDQPIESLSMRRLPVEERKRTYTNALAVFASKALTKIGAQLSPIQIEYILNSYTGGFARQIPTRGIKEAADFPIIGRLLVRMPEDPKRQTNAFFRDYTRLQQQYAADKIKSVEDLAKYQILKGFYHGYWRDFSKVMRLAIEKNNKPTIKALHEDLANKLKLLGY